MNIKFHYLYRDGGNYKQYHCEIFSNNNALSLEEIDAVIKSSLIDGTWFYADKWNIKDLHLYKWNADIDHEWHEYDFVEETKEGCTSGDIFNFLYLIQKLNK